ncbi:hypothetical protein KM043_004210 [Ampulex compressa]|nr:hypothetical protein KM043_004210 [Ampulex compressa]
MFDQGTGEIAARRRNFNSETLIYLHLDSPTGSSFRHRLDLARPSPYFPFRSTRLPVRPGIRGWLLRRTLIALSTPPGDLYVFFGIHTLSGNACLAIDSLLASQPGFHSPGTSPECPWKNLRKLAPFILPPSLDDEYSYRGNSSRGAASSLESFESPEFSILAKDEEAGIFE